MVENFSSRSYQENLLSHALKENAIIYLPTGSGKTFIALMALETMSKDLHGTIAEGGKRSVFLCNTIALAKQQHEVIKNFTKLKTRCYTGDMNVDNWKRDKWEIEFDKYQVFVSTCQIILDCVRHNFITINDFNLLIFDECHHAQGGHPMHQLMKSFMYYEQKKLPRVIGLTGLLVTSSSKSTVIKHLNDLEAVFRAKIITVENIDEFKNVLTYSTNPKESILKFRDVIQIKLYLNARIECIIEDCISKIKLWKVDETHLKMSKNLGNVRAPNSIKKLENLLKDFLYQMKDMGLYAASLAILAVLVEVELKKRGAETSVYRNMLRSVIGTIERIRHIIAHNMYDPNDENEKEHDVILENSTPKMHKFFNYLESTFVGRDMKDIKCLVFVQRRHTAKVLYHVIKAYVNSRTSLPIVPEFMVGNAESMPESIESILDIKYSRKVLDSFQRSECNMIVASSVLEEGIDIQSCNYVFIFDKLLGFRQYVQTKGRARMKTSDFVVMIPDSEDQMLIKKIEEYKEIDLLLKQYLVGKTIDRTPPLLEETKKQFEVLIEPFISPHGARLEAESALPLLTRYCASLPNDYFTKSTLSWSLVTKTPVILKLDLPIQSTIKDTILSDAMDNVKIAKKSAAFKACKILYDNGEFDNHLLPITNKKRMEMIKPKYFKHWEAFPMDHPKTAGTRKNRRKHEIQYPMETYSAAPIVHEKCYLYSILFEPQFETDFDEPREYISNTLKKTESYAILSKKEIPPLAAMPLFLSQGEVIVRILPNPNILQLQSEKEIEKLRNFHIMIFKDLLRYPWTEYYAINYENKENSFMIVPISNIGEIDWNIVENFQCMSEVCSTNDLQRRRLILKKEDFLNKVVSTWYAPDNTVRYMVKAIRDDLNPCTPFPSQTHESFADYIDDKYQVKIQNKTQFLIEVQAITSRRNMLIFNQGNRKKTSKKFDTIILIPEACYNFYFPSTLWLKAKFIPSMLHRLHYMLIAENIRNRFNQYLKVVSINYKPKPLIVDKSLPRVITGQIEENIASRLPSIVKNTLNENSNDQAAVLFRKHKYKWAPYMEPINIDRNLPELYKIDVEYRSYFKQMYEQLSELNIADDDQQFKPHKIETAEIISKNNSLAICDINNRREINLLNIAEPQSPEQWEILSAITTAGANDVFDMERMEVLGDCFLKFSISLYLLKQHPNWNEGHLTTVKGQFVSNRNLFYISVNNKLPGALVAREFKGNEFMPPLVSVPQNAKNLVERESVSESVFTAISLNEHEILKGECEEGTLNNFRRKFVHYQIPDNESDICYLLNKCWISDKICADAIEALLGVCVQKYGVKKSFSILQFFGICSETDFDLQNLLKLELGNPRLKTNIPDREVDSFLLNYDELEKNLTYKFKDRAYLLQALTHPSYPTNRITGCYQQLEFIGDAILDFLITAYIFERCKDMDPGKLTDLRSALVNNVTLACIAVRNKFHLFLLSQNASLTQSIMRFYEFQKQQNFRITHQVRILLLEDETNNSMADYIDVPKALGDIVEALIGAIFLDSNNDLHATWNVIYNLMENEINEFMVNVPIQVVRQLQEYHGADHTFSAPIINDDIVMIKCRFTCRDELKEVAGFGKNKEQAKISAAKLALQILDKA